MSGFARWPVAWLLSGLVAVTLAGMATASNDPESTNARTISSGSVVVSIVTAPCPVYGLDDGGWSCYDSGTRAVYMPRFDRFTFLHELGHAYDFQTLTDADHASLSQFLTTPGDWSGGTFWGKDEEFASDYALCAMGDDLVDRRVCAFLDLHPASVESVSISSAAPHT